MNSEQFINYLKNPSLLYQITYQELNSLVSTYPYCQNLRYLLARKSQLDNNKDYLQNLQLAATFSIDRSFLHRQIQKEVYSESNQESFILEEEFMELKDLPKSDKTEPDIPNQSLEEPIVTLPTAEEEAAIDEIFAEDDDLSFELAEPDEHKAGLSVIEQLIKGQQGEEIIEIKDEYIPESEDEMVEAAEHIPDPEASNKSDNKIIFFDDLVEENQEIGASEIEDTKEEEQVEDETEVEEDTVAPTETLIHEWNVNPIDHNIEDHTAVNHSSDSDEPTAIIQPAEPNDQIPADEPKHDLTDGIENAGEEASIHEADEKSLPKAGQVKSFKDFYNKENRESEIEKPVKKAVIEKIIKKEIKEERKKPAPKESFSSWLKKFQTPEPEPEQESKPKVEQINKPKKKKKKAKKKLKPKKIKLQTVIDHSPKHLGKSSKKKKKKKKKKSKVKELAMKSISERDDIASETLAEILAHQGSYMKAIKMYERLMLIFPEKSTFFAERIDKLKKL